jgi:hypothetical protein
MYGTFELQISENGGEVWNQYIAISEVWSDKAMRELRTNISRLQRTGRTDWRIVFTPSERLKRTL